MYDYKAVEEKWNRIWKNNKTYKTLRDRLKSPFFAYVGYNSPSIDSFVKVDILSRYQRMNGANVLFPAIKESENKRLLGIGQDENKLISGDFLYRSQVQLLDLLIKTRVVYEKEENEVIHYLAPIDDFFEIVNKMALPEATAKIKQDFFRIKEGYDIILPVKDNESIVRIFTLEPERLFLTSFLVVPYASDLALNATNIGELEDLLAYRSNPIKDEIIFSGNYVHNPITNTDMPLFIGSVDDVILGCPALDDFSMMLAVKYDLDSLSMDYFDDFSLHLRNNAIDILSKQALITTKNVFEALDIEIATKKEEYVFDDIFNAVRFVLAPIASAIDLDINVIDYKDEINKWLPIDLYVYQDGFELLSSLLVHHLLNKANFILNNIFAKKIIYHNPKNENSEFSGDIGRMMAITNISCENANNILQMVWRIFSYQMLDHFNLNDNAFQIFIKTANQSILKRDYHLLLQAIVDYLYVVEKNKAQSYDQALSLLKIISIVMPYISEEIYQTVFNDLDTIIYLDWPN